MATTELEWTSAPSEDALTVKTRHDCYCSTNTVLISLHYIQCFCFYYCSNTNNRTDTITTTTTNSASIMVCTTTRYCNNNYNFYSANTAAATTGNIIVLLLMLVVLMYCYQYCYRVTTLSYLIMQCYYYLLC